MNVMDNSARSHRVQMIKQKEEKNDFHKVDEWTCCGIHF